MPVAPMVSTRMECAFAARPVNRGAWGGISS